MLRLLEKEKINRLRLLQQLLQEDEPKPITYLAEQLTIDRRTLNRLLDSLRLDIIASKFHQKIHLSLPNNSLVQATKDPTFDLQNFNLYYLKDAKLFNLCLDIFNHEFTNVEQFAIKHFYSTSTVYRSIVDFKKLLKQYELTLDLSSKPFIIGEEQQVRFFFFLFFSESYEMLEWPFPAVSQDYLGDLAKTVLRSFSDLPFLSSSVISTWLAVTMVRIEQGHILQVEGDYIEISNYLISKNHFFVEIEPLAQSLPLFIKLTKQQQEYELNFIYYIFSSTCIYPLKSLDNLDLGRMNLNQNNLPDSLSRRWIAEFCQQFKVTLNPTEYFYLLANLSSLHSRVCYLPGPVADFGFLENGANIKQILPNTYRKITQFSNYLAKMEEFKLLRCSNQLPVFYVLIVADLLGRKEEPLVVYIHSKVSVLQSDLLEMNLMNYADVPLTFASNLADNVDLVFTDSTLPQLKDQQVFYWSPVPTEKEWQKAASLIHECYYQKYTVNHWDG